MVGEKLKTNGLSITTGGSELHHLQCWLQCIKSSVDKFQDNLLKPCLQYLPGEQEKCHLQ